MSKAVLVMDMPERCDECVFNQVAFDSEIFREGEVYCCVNIESVDKNMNNGTKPDWCPLRELPEKILEQKSGLKILELQCVVRVGTPA